MINHVTQLFTGIWAMALAIQTVAQRVKLKHKEKTVQDFKYRDKEWETLFLDALSNVTFEGVTVSMTFKFNVQYFRPITDYFKHNSFQ